MKTIFLITFTLFMYTTNSFSQINLIRNASFEDTLGCPFNVSGQYGEQIYFLEHWFPAAESPDYFNVCSNSQVSIPQSGFGFQYPNSGSAYIGLFTSLNSNSFPNYKEYLGIALSQNLTVGVKYYFKMHISAAFGGVQGLHTFSNNLGIKLSSIYYESQQNPLYSDNQPTAYVDSIISDTTNWVPLYFSFVADSAYQYLYLGNFFDPQSTDTIIPFGFTGSQGAYYFIDDLCLSTDSNYCDLILSSNNNKDDLLLSVYPNPTQDILFFQGLKQDVEIEIFDVLGRDFGIKNIKLNDPVLDISSFPQGSYLIRSVNSVHKSIIFIKF